MNKRIVITLLSAVLIVTGLVGADYLGWLGVKQSSYIDYFNVNYQTTDADSGELIQDFFVNCTRKGSRNACSIEQGMDKMSRLIKFGMVKNSARTWLFDRGEEIIGLDDVTIHLMFIHQDYDRKTITYSMRELLGLEGQMITVPLEKVKS